MARKAKDTPHLRLRIEPSLLGRLEKSAEKNGRTLTGEIVDRLDASFKRDDMQAYVDATAQRIAEKLLAAAAPDSVASRAIQRKIIEGELFELDLKVLQEEDPDTPVEEHARYLREAAARRAKLGGRS
jgi:Arc-like DNA binding domain